MAKIRRALLVSIDNLRSDCVGRYPSSRISKIAAVPRRPPTPTLDHLADSGCFFPHCFVSAPYTTASHASMLTGCFPIGHGVREYYRTPIATDVLTLFSRFKRAGYTTILATDFPALLGPILGFTRDVDHYIVTDDDEVRRLLGELAGPVFCFWHFGSVHNPFGLTSPAIDGYHFERSVVEVADLAGVARPDVLGPEWMEADRPVEERMLRQWYFRATERLYEEDRYGDLMSLYTQGISYFDSTRLARVVECMDALRARGDMLAVVTADHGEEYSRRAYAHFNGLWEGIVEVPLFVIAPEIPADHTVHDLARSVDIAPTMLELAGIGEPKPDSQFRAMDGVSLAQTLRRGLPHGHVAIGESLFGMTEVIRDHLTNCFDRGQLLPSETMANRHLLYVRDARWKLIVERDLSSGSELGHLFDLKADVGEEIDVIASYPAAATNLRRHIDRYLDLEPRRADSAAVGNTEHIARALVDMGYFRARHPEEHDHA
jgi:arylsulfatase A-like enzyme